jgi:hypothetical protein
MIKFAFEWLLGDRIRHETLHYLGNLVEANLAASRCRADTLLEAFRKSSEPKIALGQTAWGAPVEVPISEIIQAHGIVSGTTGSGKTRLALAIVKGLLDRIVEDLISGTRPRFGFGELDPKGDLFRGTLYLVAQKLGELQKTHPDVAHKFRQLIVPIDFSSPDPVTSYNVFVRWPDVELDYFVNNRADIFMDLLPTSERPSLSGSGALNKLIRLMSYSGQPITKMADVVEDECFRAKLVAACPDRALAAYFTRQFPQVPRSTLAALLRRIDALFAADSVRLALGGVSTPDFRGLQDEGKIVLIKCFGKSIPRSARRVLQKWIFSDITQSVFSREHPDLMFCWICDEGRSCFESESLRENVAELSFMARSFGSFVLYILQDAHAAVHDANLLRVLNTCTQWCVAMRGDPADCTWIKPALPFTGRRVRPRAHPFSEQTFYSPLEERALVHEEIASLPDRTAYIWWKRRSPEALRLQIKDVPMPGERELLRVTAWIRCDAAIGNRLSRKQYDKLVAERDRKWADEPDSLAPMLRRAYQQSNGQVES